MRSVNDEWPRDEVRILIEMREQGYTSPQIGARIGRTAKAIISKARALRLPRSMARPVAPQQAAHRETALPIERAGKTTLPPLPSLSGKDYGSSD
ncbi:MAG TPA: hypothetical protein VGI78_10900 [Acetobacteraceae bacterium]|jgi:hypothetical protein